MTILNLLIQKNFPNIPIHILPYFSIDHSMAEVALPGSAV
jgi:hypothetical protein